jgi:hypothetical protein
MLLYGRKECPGCSTSVGWRGFGAHARRWECPKCGAGMGFNSGRKALGALACGLFMFLSFALSGPVLGSIHWWYIFLIAPVGAGLVYWFSAVEAR